MTLGPAFCFQALSEVLLLTFKVLSVQRPEFLHPWVPSHMI